MSTSFSVVSVVRIALAKALPRCVDGPKVILTTPFRIRAIGNSTPINPVLDGSTSSGSSPRYVAAMAAISMANLKMAGSHAGISIGQDGPSQMGLEDLACMRTIPGCTVLYPSDAVSAEASVKLAAENHGMFFIRTSRPNTPVLYSNDVEFEIGKAKVLRSSDTDVVTVVAAEVTLFEALKAYDSLRSDGVNIRIIDLFSVKPIDEEAVRESAQETAGKVITVEDHYPEGGIGEAVQSALMGTGAHLRLLAVRDLPRSGKPEELLVRYKIDADHIVAAVSEMAG